VTLQQVHLVGVSINVPVIRQKGLVVNTYTNLRCLQYYNTRSNWS